MIMTDYRHLLAMTDATGLLQFSNGKIPDPRSGYTLDDNARALIVSLHMKPGETDYTQHFLDYLDRSQMADGTLSNFLLDGKYYARFDSEDSIGRTIMALSAATHSERIGISQKANRILMNIINKPRSFSSPRAIAYTLIGLCKAQLTDLDKYRPALITYLSDYLLDLYSSTKSLDWLWFEDSLTYCNAILPQALFCVYSFNGNKNCLHAAYDSLSFLNDIVFSEGYLNVIGNQGWLSRARPSARFDQQPVDAASTAFACWEAYHALGRKEHLDLAKLAHQWYRGENIHKLSLYDASSGGCYDSLTCNGVNLNQGAEASLSLIFTDLLINGNIGTEFQLLKLPV